MSAALHAALREKGRTVLSSDQKLGLGAGERYVYADVSVVCDRRRLRALAAARPFFSA